MGSPMDLLGAGTISLFGVKIGYAILCIYKMQENVHLLEFQKQNIQRSNIISKCKNKSECLFHP
jgi:hypothetical protein